MLRTATLGVRPKNAKREEKVDNAEKEEPRQRGGRESPQSTGRGKNRNYEDTSRGAEDSKLPFSDLQDSSAFNAGTLQGEKPTD